MTGIVIRIIYLRHAKKMEKGYIAEAKEQRVYVEPEPPTIFHTITHLSHDL